MKLRLVPTCDADALWDKMFIKVAFDSSFHVEVISEIILRAMYIGHL